MKWTWDKFGYFREPSAPPQNPNVILERLGLSGVRGVKVIFFGAVRRAVVTVAAPDAMPSLVDIRYASLESEWDVEVFASDAFDRLTENAAREFSRVRGVSSELARALVVRGYFSFDDLATIHWCELMEPGGLGKPTADAIIEQAELKSQDKWV